LTFLFPTTINAKVALQSQKFLFQLGAAFSTKQWWSVDLRAICKVHLVRVVTDVNYKPDDLKNLVIRVGEVTTPETTLKVRPYFICHLKLNEKLQEEILLHFPMQTSLFTHHFPLL